MQKLSGTRPLAAVMNDDTVHGDVWSAARANDFDSLRRLLKDKLCRRNSGSGVTPIIMCKPWSRETSTVSNKQRCQCPQMRP